MKENNFNIHKITPRIEEGTSVPAGDETEVLRPEYAIDADIISLLKTSKLEDPITQSKLMEWRELNGLYEMNNQDVVNINAFVDYAIKEINLFDQAGLVKEAYALAEALRDTAEHYSYEDMQSIYDRTKGLYIKSLAGDRDQE